MARYRMVERKGWKNKTNTYICKLNNPNNDNNNNELATGVGATMVGFFGSFLFNPLITDLDTAIIDNNRRQRLLVINVISLA